MKITKYFRDKEYIVAFDNCSFIHWIEVKDMYRFLIDNFLLDCQVDDKKFELTFDEWFKEPDICCIDLGTYLEAQELKKKIMGTFNNITKTYKPWNNQHQSPNSPKA